MGALESESRATQRRTDARSTDARSFSSAQKFKIQNTTKNCATMMRQTTTGIHPQSHHCNCNVTLFSLLKEEEEEVDSKVVAVVVVVVVIISQYGKVFSNSNRWFFAGSCLGEERKKIT
jgi:hypothetical protein